MSGKEQRGKGNMTTTISALVSLPDSPSTFSPPTLYGTSLLSSLSPLSESRMKEGRSTKAPSMTRKRPARICIPAPETKRLLELGSWGGNDKDDGIGEVEVEVEEDGYSVYSRRGKRARQSEDRFSVVVGVEEGSDKRAFFGVFDGHGGAKAADFVAQHLHANIKEQLAWDDSNVQKAVRDAYLKTEEEFESSSCDDGARGGTCCVSALVFKGSLVVSNVGDCRAVVSSDGVAKALTTDHLPSVISEKERILTKGGYVDCCNGIWRIQGSLAVSRSIGDRYLKQWVISEPDTRILPITPRQEFLILASDGLWEKVSDQEAVDLARPFLIGNGKPSSSSACRELAELSMRRGSRDDITVMIVELGQFVDSN